VFFFTTAFKSPHHECRFKKGFWAEKISATKITDSRRFRRGVKLNNIDILWVAVTKMREGAYAAVSIKNSVIQ
jgi:hypothetical protein